MVLTSDSQQGTTFECCTSLYTAASIVPCSRFSELSVPSIIDADAMPLQSMFIMLVCLHNTPTHCDLLHGGLRLCAPACWSMMEAYSGFNMVVRMCHPLGACGKEAEWVSIASCYHWGLEQNNKRKRGHCVKLLLTPHRSTSCMPVSWH